jgi:hypothetical protein
MKKSKAIHQISVSMYAETMEEYKYLISKNINISYEIRKFINDLYKKIKIDDNISNY